ncbi:hypothetical protein T439DRAFT_329027 [Meredithblackwellia eburnea MCA 4105]
MAPNTTLAAIPRSLKLGPSTAITRTHLLALYREQLRASYAFESYNFRNYFIRKTRDKFRTELPSLLDAAYSASSTGAAAASTSSSQPSEAPASDSIYAPTSSSSSPNPPEVLASGNTTPEARLRAWYAESLAELGVMSRAAVVNRLYESPKLVVEVSRGQPAVGGGGAGAEASYGGGGQPAAPK